MEAEFKVLVIDDDEDIRSLLEEVLTTNPNFVVSCASNGLIGLDMLKKGCFDLVLTDIKMPIMDGIEFLQQAKQLYPEMPVVIMSGYAEFNFLARALELGANNFIRKPFVFQEVFQVILKILKSREKFLKQSRIFPHISIETTIEFPSDSELVDGIAVYLTMDLLNYNLCNVQDINNIRLSIHEALMNAIEHGNKNDRTKNVKIIKKVDPTTILFTIRDQGVGFDFGKVPDPTLPENIMNPRGRGLLLIRSFMDEVKFKDNGCQLEMTKRRQMND